MTMAMAQSVVGVSVSSTAGAAAWAPRPKASALAFMLQPTCSRKRGQRSLRFQDFHVRAFEPAAATPEKVAPAIQLTKKATAHLKKLKADNDSVCLRIGVRQGGCSGMSYVMDFEDQSKVLPDDSVIEADGIKLVCDPKSLLFIFGMQLDYSDALIGGGFSFNNPNASSSCGCGKSFTA